MILDPESPFSTSASDPNSNAPDPYPAFVAVSSLLQRRSRNNFRPSRRYKVKP